MKRLLIFFFCMSLAALAHAQEAAPEEEDVIYFRDGGKLRGTVVGGNKKTGRIMLRDGNIFVYKKAAIKMLAKEPVETPNAKEDSIKMALVAKNVIAEEKEAEREARRKEGEIAALQKMMEGNKKVEKKDDGGSTFRFYSSLEVLGGLGLSKLPAANDTTPALDNKQRLMGFHYALGGRTDYFYIGLNIGMHQTHRNLSPLAAAVLDTLPTTLLSLPLGMEMRVEFAPKAGMSPYLGVNGGYALSLTEGVNSYVMLNPSFGFRFGGRSSKVGSQLSVGYLMQMDGSKQTSYLTLKLGIVF